MGKGHPHPNLPPSRGKEAQGLTLYRKMNFARRRGVSTIPEKDTDRNVFVSHEEVRDEYRNAFFTHEDWKEDCSQPGRQSADGM